MRGKGLSGEVTEIQPRREMADTVAGNKHATSPDDRCGLEFRDQAVEDAIVEGIRPGGIAKLHDVRGALACDNERR